MDVLNGEWTFSKAYKKNHECIFPMAIFPQAPNTGNWLKFSVPWMKMKEDIRFILTL